MGLSSALQPRSSISALFASLTSPNLALLRSSESFSMRGMLAYGFGPSPPFVDLYLNSHFSSAVSMLSALVSHKQAYLVRHLVVKPSFLELA